jgi:hypothetical protein
MCHEEDLKCVMRMRLMAGALQPQSGAAVTARRIGTNPDAERAAFCGRYRGNHHLETRRKSMNSRIRRNSHPVCHGAIVTELA